MEISQFKDYKTSVDPIHPYLDSIRSGNVPIIIDNGSYNSRVGWSTSENPLLIFKNVLAKPRKERGKKDGEMQVGNNITNIEAVRFQLKTQFDRNVVTHFEVQEHILNYTFTHLGINEETVNHPIVMTEAMLNPNYSRMLGGGYTATHVLPIVNGIPQAKQVRRLDVGGQNITSYLHRLLQLKYPAHFNSLSYSRAEELFHDYCHIAKNYGDELENWSDANYYDENVRCIQLPYSTGSTLTPEQQKERRRELARRLIEMNARKREEKLAEDEEHLNQLLAIQDFKDEGEEAEFQKSLLEFGLDSPEELTKLITQVQIRIEKTRQKIANSMANNMEDAISEDPKVKMMKNFQMPKCEEEIKVWIENARKKREEILEKRAVRQQRRQDLAKRHTVASVERMRLISLLAANSRDDDFGSRDEDWDVYKEGDSDSEGETAKLLELEDLLRSVDRTFPTKGQNEAESYRLHVGIETIRAPEILFQPSMIGSHQAGLSEVIAKVLAQYPENIALNLAKDVCLTGGLARIPGLKDRIVVDLTEVRPFRSEINVRILPNPSLGAWYGCKHISNSDEFQQLLVTKSEYLEKGGDYLKEHKASNLYIPNPMSTSDASQQSLKADDLEMEII